MQVEYMSGIQWWMQKYHKKDDNVHYMTKNYVLKPIYSDENECINDTLSLILIESDFGIFLIIVVCFKKTSQIQLNCY